MTIALTDMAEVLRRGAAHNPDGEVARFGDRAWTWAQWSERIHRAAAAQRAAGLQPGDRVAFLDKNHLACVETTLACALVGTANAVVNFRLAPAEVSYTINDAAAKVVFVGAELLEVIEAVREQLSTVQRVVVVGGPDDGYERWLEHEPLTEPYSPAPDDCFLQLYTSGTTGFPKGAMLTHRAMLAHAEHVAADAGLRADSAAMVAMPLYHVGGSSWALVALYAGARIVVVREPVPDQLLAGLEAQRITHTFFVPALLGFLVQVPDVRERDLSALECLCYGASPMPLPLLRTCLDVFDTDFYQVYGLTEVCGVATMLGPDDHRDPGSEHLLLSAGKPITGVRVEIRDHATGAALPAGETGEVWMRTDQVMSGYYGKPEATAEVMPGDDWLQTGDAGHLDGDGYLYITDRVKDMIVSGGENIYPAEIERVLIEHADVTDVAVIGVPDDRWGEVGLAVVVRAADAAQDEAELLDYARLHLASFKVPAAVSFVEELPRNPTGKILKRQLRDKYWEGRERRI